MTVERIKAKFRILFPNTKLPKFLKTRIRCERLELVLG